MIIRYFVLLCLSAISLFDYGCASREEEGYPNGYLSDCPGSTKKSIIKKSSLKHLKFVVVGADDARSEFNYWTVVEGLRASAHFDPRRRTVVFFSGYVDSTEYPIARTVGTTYHDLDYNVLLLDTQYFTAHHYYVAARLARAVGRRTAEALWLLWRAGVLSLATTELLGLSLGAQIAGFTAKSFQRLTGGAANISRITALDPAGPCFRHLPPAERLDAADADFVDVVCTNIDGWGMAAPLGHVNFYVNGGEYQLSLVEWVPCTIFCSHMRSLLLWLEMLRQPGGFVALRCDSVQQARDHRCYERPLAANDTTQLALRADTSKRGIFYLATTNNYPFYLGLNGLKKEYQLFSTIAGKYNKEDVLRV